MKIKTQSMTFMFLGVIAVLLLWNQYGLSKLNNKMSTCITGAVVAEQIEKTAKQVEVDFYVMSYCPYGDIAEEALEPVYRVLKDNVNFNPKYIFYNNYQGGGPAYCIDAESKYCSMHGVQEANQGIRELCVEKYFGSDAFFEFTLAMNQQCNYKNADTCWQSVAESVGLDVDSIQNCYDDEVLELAAAELSATQEMGVSGSPTVFINGQQYNGPRTPEGYKQAICSEFDSPPDECSATLASDTTAPLGTC